MGAVAGFCGAPHRCFIARKLLGTAPDKPGDSPEFTRCTPGTRNEYMSLEYGHYFEVLWKFGLKG